MGKLATLTREEIQRVQQHIDSKRDKLVLFIIYETGCTVNELVHIRRSDLDFTRCTIFFPAEHTKTQQARKSQISYQLCQDIKEFLSKHKSRFLLPSRQSGQITTKRVRQLIMSYGKLAGFRKLLPKTIRYSHIAHALRKGIPLTTIQKQVGLKDLRMMQIYERLKLHEREDEYKKFWS